MYPLSIINPSLEIGYCCTTLSNHDIIRLVTFILKIKEGLSGCGMSLFINLQLVLLKIDGTCSW
jgi:hypothetical protein